MAIFLLLFFLPRLGFVKQEAINEENIFLLTSQFASAGFPLTTWAPIGICDGMQIRETPQHPVTHFAYFHLYGRLLGSVGLKPSDTSFTLMLRIFQLIVLSLALSLLVKSIIGLEFDRSPFRQFAFVISSAAVMASPFFVGASIQLQFDGVIGTIPYLLILAALMNQKSGRAGGVLLFLSALLVGLDKPERLMLWIFSRASVALFLPTFVRKMRRPLKDYLPELCGYSLSVIFLVSIDPSNWFAFLALTTHAVTGSKDTITQYFKFSRHFIGLEYVVPVFFALATGLKRLFWKTGPPVSKIELSHEAIVAMSVFAMLIFTSAFVVRFEGDSFARYFAPAMFPTAVLSASAIVRYLSFDVKTLVPFVFGFFAIAAVNIDDLSKMRGHSITSVYSRILSPITCPVVRENDGCIRQIPYECVKVGYSANFILHENADAIGSQCKIPICVSE